MTRGTYLALLLLLSACSKGDSVDPTREFLFKRFTASADAGVNVSVDTPKIHDTPTQVETASGRREIVPQVAQFIAEREIKPELKDPGSARFEGVHGSNLPTVPGTAINGWSIICGTVNAKNGFGGYSGAEPFVVILMSPTQTEVHLARSTRRRDFQKMWEMCA